MGPFVRLHSSLILSLYIDLLILRAHWVSPSVDWDLNVRGAGACDGVSSAATTMVVTHCACRTSSSLSSALLPRDEEEVGGWRKKGAERGDHARRGWYFVWDAHDWEKTEMALSRVLCLEEELTPHSVPLFRLMYSGRSVVLHCSPVCSLLWQSPFQNHCVRSPRLTETNKKSSSASSILTNICQRLQQV